MKLYLNSGKEGIFKSLYAAILPFFWIIFYHIQDIRHTPSDIFCLNDSSIVINLEKANLLLESLNLISFNQKNQLHRKI